MVIKHSDIPWTISLIAYDICLKLRAYLQMDKLKIYTIVLYCSLRTLRKVMDDEEERWDEYIEGALFALNTSQKRQITAHSILCLAEIHGLLLKWKN